MRVAFFALLLANLVLVGWSQWLAPPTSSDLPVSTGAAGAGGAPLRRIVLASERVTPSAAATPDVAAASALAGSVESASPQSAAMVAAAAGTAVDPATTGSASATPTAASPVPADTRPADAPAAPSTGGLSPASARGAPAAGSAPAAALAASTSGAVTPVVASATALAKPAGAGAGRNVASLAAPATRCASMGPFADLELTAQATAMLKQDGYAPRQRPANGAVPDGYMVVIRRLRNEADQARVVARLNRGGLDDAFAIPKLADGHAVSVGLFSQRQRAERRSLAVGKMGFKSEIVERTRPGTVYWLDFDLKTSGAGDADPFARTADPSEKLQVVPCPGTAAVG